jgi:hypothetical protein
MDEEWIIIYSNGFISCLTIDSVYSWEKPSLNGVISNCSRFVHPNPGLIIGIPSKW